MIGVRPELTPEAHLGSVAGAALIFLRVCGGVRHRRLGLDAPGSVDQRQPEPLLRQLQWMLMALDAYERGHSAKAAMRAADADGHGAAAARQAFLALAAQAGAERSLVAHLRRRMLAQAAAPLRMLSRSFGRVLDGH